jgi:hypothetical protein
VAGNSGRFLMVFGDPIFVAFPASIAETFSKAVRHEVFCDGRSFSGFAGSGIEPGGGSCRMPSL